MPFAGARNWQNITVRGKWTYWDYWSSTNSTEGASMRINIHEDFLQLDQHVLSEGKSLRCFKNVGENNWYRLSFKNNWLVLYTWYVRFWWEPVAERFKPSDPIKEWHSFLWWYNWN